MSTSTRSTVTDDLQRWVWKCLPHLLLYIIFSSFFFTSILKTTFMRFNLHIIKLNHFKSTLHTSWQCPQSGDHHHSQNIGHFPHCKSFLVPFWDQSLLPMPTLRQSSSASCPYVSIFSRTSLKWNHRMYSPFLFLISFTKIVFSKFIQTAKWFCIAQ